MKTNEHQIVESLSGTDVRLIEHLPYLLQDLFSLGSDPEILIQLIDRNINKLNKVRYVLELCCGKGALLINIIKKYNWSGKGIDLFKPFIQEARSTALKENLADKTDFEVMDIRDAVGNLHGFDMIIYGSDASCFGNELQALKKISGCLIPEGYIMYDTAYNKTEPLDLLLKKEFDIIDKIEYEPERVKSLNNLNNNKIRIRAEELAQKYPELKHLFYDYVKLQEAESLDIEERFICAAYLLKCKKQFNRQVKPQEVFSSDNLA